MANVKFEDTVVKTKVGDEEITVTSDGEKFIFKIKDDNWSFTINGSSGAEVKSGDNTFSVTKPEAGEFPFPKVSLTHDNKEIELPGKAGKIASSTVVSGLPLTLTLNASLTRSGEELTVTEEAQNLIGTKRSFKVDDWIAEEPTFKNAGTLDHLLLGILLGPTSFRFAKKVTLNFGEISISPVEKSKTKIKIDNKQTAKIEIRPYVTLEKLVEVITSKGIELAIVIKDLAAAKAAVSEFASHKQEQERKQKQYEVTKTAIIVTTSVLAAATAAAAVFWWNPGGWASAAVIVEKTAELAALTTALTLLGTAATAALGAAVVSAQISHNILNRYNIDVPNNLAGLQQGVQQLQDKVDAMQRDQQQRNSYKMKVGKQEGTTLIRIH